jgi:uncharacterized protein YbbC (DUF1343 family)
MKRINKLLKMLVIPVLFIMVVTAASYGQMVETGLESLIKSDFATLREKRVGLVTNPTGVHTLQCSQCRPRCTVWSGAWRQGRVHGR